VQGYPLLVAMLAKEKGAKVVPVAPLLGSPCALVPALALPLQGSPCAFSCRRQQQAKVLCWRLRTGHKLLALFPPLLPPLLLRTGHKLLALFPPLLPLRCRRQQQAKVLCWQLRTGHKLRC
jgi:hypothetical protein